MSADQVSQAELDAFTARWNAGPILGFLGLEIALRARERVIVSIPRVRPEQRGGKGSDAVNGGVIAAMFDFAIGACAIITPPVRRNATVQLSIMFERAVRGDSARCEAVVERAAHKLLFASATVFDAAGNACSRATGVVHLGEPCSFAEWTSALAGPA